MEDEGQDKADFPDPVEIEIIIVHTKFPLGLLVATPAALNALEDSGESSYKYLAKHCAGNWGELCPEDWATNDDALETGGRLLSAYKLSNGVSIWIITEWDRSVTTILLPFDY